MEATEKEKAPQGLAAMGANVTNCGKDNTPADAAQVRKAAAEYHARGWHPIPLAAPEPGNTSSGKAPTLRAWQNHRTAAHELARFWPDGSRGNIGINLGPSRLVVLDFDTPEAFAPWAAANPEAAQSFTVARTNAEPGRCHLYFALAEGQAAPANQTKTATGWGDLLAIGRQVVAPPSVHHTGGRYIVTNDAPPLPWKDEYTPALWGKDKPKARPLYEYLPRNEPPAGPGIPPSVAAAIAAGAGDGERNETAFQLACQLRDEGHAEGAALGMLLRFAARCRPPLDENELARTVRSAYATAPREPARNPTAPRYVQHPAGAPPPPPGPPEPTPPDDWPEPEPLGALDHAPPPWPWAVMPRTLRGIGRSIAETMNVPDELPGLAALCCASIACRKVATVAIKDDHRQFPNVFGMAVLPPATGKSPASKPLLAPLLSWQIEARKVWAVEHRAWSARAKIAKAEVTGLEKRAARGEGDPDELARRVADLEAITEARPAPPLLFMDNCTGEALSRTMGATGGRMGVFSTDARDVLGIIGGKYTQTEDIGLWLKGHGGDYCAYHRAAIDKPPFEIPEPVLSSFLAVQPDALRAMGKKTALTDSGFLARWLFVIPATNGCTDYPETSVPDYLRREYAGTITALLGMTQTTDEAGEPTPHVCRLDDAARAVWVTAHNAIKPGTLAAAPLLASCLGKLPEHMARIALIFHLVECAERNEPPGGVIGAATVERAATLAHCLLGHIRRACAMMGDSDTRSRGRELWAAIDKHRERLADLRAAEGLGRIEAVKPRDVQRFGWAGVEDAAQARELLAGLEVKGWLRLRTAPARTPDARSHELYELRPHDGGGV